MLKSKFGDEAKVFSNAQRMVKRGNRKRIFFIKGILSIGRNHNITRKKKAPLVKFSPSSKIHGERRMVFFKALPWSPTGKAHGTSMKYPPAPIVGKIFRYASPGLRRGIRQ
jgi:hypothetical protein